MPTLLPPPTIGRCSVSSRSFLLGPDGPCGGSTWTSPALRRSYRTTGEPGAQTRSVLQSLHGSRGTPDLPRHRWLRVEAVASDGGLEASRRRVLAAGLLGPLPAGLGLEAAALPVGGER
jgi:hypothetical protein